MNQSTRFSSGGDSSSQVLLEEFPVEASIPDGIASLNSILYTEELRRRPCRPPDYEKENRALVALASELVASPSNILRRLAETILEVTQCDSSGLSLLTKDDGGKRFYWPAIAGMWGPHVGGGTPRDFGPCGDVLDQNRTLLFRHFERRYPYLLPVVPMAEECLLVPFYVGGKAVGTIWAIMHSDRRKFDAEDERIMSTLGQFASLAYQTVESIEDLKLQIAEREKAEAAVRELATGLEAKTRRLIDANLIGIFIWNLDGRIVEANEAFLRIVGYDRNDLTSGRLRWRELTPVEWRDADERRVAELEATGTAQPHEKEYFRKDGSRVPVLVGGATFEERSDEGVGFVLDLTDRKRADEAVRQGERRYREIEMELARANRVATMGELTASITHELRQPLSAAVTNGTTCQHWLSEDTLDLDRARRAAQRMIAATKRASEVMDGIRGLLNKTPPERTRVNINDLLRETLMVMSAELRARQINVATELAEPAPSTIGERVQLQQVVLNLIMNGVEAIGPVADRPRLLRISSRSETPASVLVAVEDSGTGLDPAVAERIFDPFFTTKVSGMGMGLSICRSIIEGHGGRLWATPASSGGAVMQFMLPAEDVAP
jgi:PAS domain S-box-containing protein